MKIEKQKEEECIPIIITLETEEEVNSMWHLGNCAITNQLKRYSEEERLSVDDIGQFKEKLWRGINNFYQPKK